jgi:hypothetical protein
MVPDYAPRASAAKLGGSPRAIGEKRIAARSPRTLPLGPEATMIRKLASGGYRLYSRKLDPKTGRRRNLGTFSSRAAAEKHERAVQYFKRGGS